MKLTDLDPRWCGYGGEGIRNADGSPVPRRERVGVSFVCPCGAPHEAWDRVIVTFANPPDGGPAVGKEPHWQRDGDTFETLTLRPSIQRVGGCGWHGYVTNGEVSTC